MTKLTVYSVLCLTFSAVIMHVSNASLDTLPKDLLTRIFIHLDTDAYQKMILNKIEGDILFISPDQQRTAENPFCFVAAKTTHLRSIICVNKYFNKAVTTFLNENQQLILSNKLLYEEPIKNFLQTNNMQFFNVVGTCSNIPIKVITELKCWDNSDRKEYQFTVTMHAASCSNIDLPFFNFEKPLENISLMLFATIKNKESTENNTYVQTLIEDLELLISCLRKDDSSFKFLILTSNNGSSFQGYGSPGNTIQLRMSRNKDKEGKWEMFPIQLFCKLIEFKNKSGQITSIG